MQTNYSGVIGYGPELLDMATKTLSFAMFFYGRMYPDHPVKASEYFAAEIELLGKIYGKSFWDVVEEKNREMEAASETIM